MFLLHKIISIENLKQLSDLCRHMWDHSGQTGFTFANYFQTVVGYEYFILTFYLSRNICSSLLTSEHEPLRKYVISFSSDYFMSYNVTVKIMLV